MCCIPFHQNDLALADIGRATRVDDRWLLDRKVEASGRIVGEVLVSRTRTSPADVAVRITSNQFDVERMNDRCDLVDVADDRDLRRLIDMLIPGLAPPDLSVGAR